MTTHDDALIAALATVTAAQRDLFRDSIETVAERHDCTVAEMVESIAWYRKAAAHYRGTPILEAAERMATALRHGPKLRPAGTGLRQVLAIAPEEPPGNSIYVDPPDLSRPKRPVRPAFPADAAAAALLPLFQRRRLRRR